jgi:hypothetical protein
MVIYLGSQKTLKKILKIKNNNFYLQFCQGWQSRAFNVKAERFETEKTAKWY